MSEIKSMQKLAGKSILLFCPKFFDYEKEIQKTLESMGARVVWFDDRPSNDFFSKALIRINKNFLGLRIKKYYNDILIKIKGDVFDYIFCVNPEAISEDILQEFRTVFPSAVFLLYMWDSFKNRKQNIGLLSFFDGKFTFDPRDAENYQLKFRPLFYIGTYRNEQSEDIIPDYDLLFIGTAHSDRYLFVKKLTGLLNKRIKLYFYLSSKLLYLTKRVLDKEFKQVKLKDISFVSLKHHDIAVLMKKSGSILDINHPQQIGLTMRTFETLGSCRKLITTNRDILKYDFYNPENIFVIDRNDPFIDNSFFEKRFVMPHRNLMFKYSIEGWATEIFE